jgi:ferredoxin
MKCHYIHFIHSPHDAISVTEGTELANILTVNNSPVLFGCRSGICGTCLVEVEEVNGKLPPPNEVEQETLSLHAPDNAKARLACQLDLTTSILLKKINSI